MPTRNINLTDHFDRFVGQQVESGQYRNASEVMRAGLRLLEQQTREEKEKLRALRALAAEGFDQLDRGQGLELEGTREILELVRDLGRRAAADGRRRRRGS